MRVGEASGDSDFPKEALGTNRCGELGAQNLDCNLASVLLLVGEEHRRHTAAPELALDCVAFR
jgi:hypothetical protein